VTLTAASIVTTKAPTTTEFTDEEALMLQECQTEAERMAIRVIVRYAHLSSSHPTYVPITQAHIDGCTYIVRITSPDND
jgi:predicted aconitase